MCKLLWCTWKIESNDNGTLINLLCDCGISKEL